MHRVRRLRELWLGVPQPCRIAVAAVVLVVADHLYDQAGDSFVPGGPLDETAHIATAWLILQALPQWVRDRFFWPAIVGSFAIDVDHVPGALGYGFFTIGTPRPYTHSLLTLVALGLAGFLWERRRNLLWGFALGVALHFFRDLAEGDGSGISLLWPFSDHAFSYSHTLYLWLMAGVVAVDLLKLVWGSRRPAGRREAELRIDDAEADLASRIGGAPPVTLAPADPQAIGQARRRPSAGGQAP